MGILDLLVGGEVLRDAHDVLCLPQLYSMYFKQTGRWWEPAGFPG
jgi:hypothetical protein